MADIGLRNRLPWEDRWSQPQVDELVQPIEQQRGQALTELMDQVERLGQITRSLNWYEPAWKWTIEYRVELGDSDEVLCYLVPSFRGPLVCVPLTDQIIEGLPMHRLNRFVRNGIRSAKCPVRIHWAQWSLTSSSEVIHLVDLIKRKVKVLSATAKAANG